MKKILNSKVMLTLVLVVTLLFATTVTAYARTVYYPSSGNASGYYEGVSKSNVCTYNNLPAGVLYMNYFVAETSTVEVRFYKNRNETGGYISARLSNTGENVWNTSITLPSSGTYYVYVYNLGASDTFQYSFNLYKD